MQHDAHVWAWRRQCWLSWLVWEQIFAKPMRDFMNMPPCS